MRSQLMNVLAKEYSCNHGAQINFGDLTPYVTSASKVIKIGRFIQGTNLLVCTIVRFITYCCTHTIITLQ
jgi:hypothetical protein